MDQNVHVITICYKLDCQVTGTPKPTLKWFKEDTELHVSDKIKIETKFDT